MGNLLHFILNHFFHVAPILACGAFAISITLERSYSLYFIYQFPYMEAFFDHIRNLVFRDKFPDAVALCKQNRGKPAVDVILSGLLRAHEPENIIEHGLQIAVIKASEKIQSRTHFLATIANVATLLGLLGTILGLIQSFEAVGAANAQQRSALLAMGIATAMNATMLGLGVAVPSMVAFSILINKINRMNAQVELAATRTLDLLKQRHYVEDIPQSREAQPSQNEEELQWKYSEGVS